MSDCAKVWQDMVTIPTYDVGEPDKNPMFLEKRVYQGSSGKVFPYPVIDKIYDEKKDKKYTALYLENEYIKIQILPELGGRIQQAIDKTNGYNFVYHNDVIKPALVGLLGPWISGGIEFNWPQHHRPTTFMKVDYTIRTDENGSASVLIYDYDRINGTSVVTTFTLYPERAFVEIHAELFNPTDVPQSFLWWANPAVAVNDNTQSIFPPDVHAVFDHGKRDVSRFPIATGVYYKHDYGSGVDISRYKNIPVPTSYMAYKSLYDFVGGYDYGENAGLLHVADHHISPGKKQWTWGCGDFGKAWDRNLTDHNGPYIELMTGVYTDNQPDFSWLNPYEQKKFTQYFMPYKKIGAVKNATTDILISLSKAPDGVVVGVYTTHSYKNCCIVLSNNGTVLFDKKASVSPVTPFTETVQQQIAAGLMLSVYDADGKLLLSYIEQEETVEKIPEAAKPALPPEKIATNEELYLTALHIEQYRHATFKSDDYYKEGLKRDPLDSSINTGYGKLLMRRGLFSDAEKCFRNAIQRITCLQPNPSDSEPYLDLGYALQWQGIDDEAYDAFYKATWSEPQAAAAFYNLAAISCRRGKYEQTLFFADRALEYNSCNIKARELRALAQLRADRDEARNDAGLITYLRESIGRNPFDYLSAFLLERICGRGTVGFDVIERIGGRVDTYTSIAFDLYRYGESSWALDLLNGCGIKQVMVLYYSAFLAAASGKDASEYYKQAASADVRCIFANTLADQIVLQSATVKNQDDATAPYLLGCLCYDKARYTEALKYWEQSESVNVSFPTTHRNLAIVLYNKENDKKRAKLELEKAYSLDESDARVFLERDQLYKKIGIDPKKRLAEYGNHHDVFVQRDDLCVEYVTLLNLTGRYDEAYTFIMNRKFHPWEGGEGRITTQYVKSLRELAKDAMQQKAYDKAEKLLCKALVFPENLGEGKLEGEKDNDIHYLLGLCYRASGKTDEAEKELQAAAIGTESPAGMMYYNDQPAEMILYQGLARHELGDEQGAKSRFYKLVDYGEKHLFDDVKIDYFAVSLPDLQLFEDDLNMRNKAHCSFLRGLGYLGLGMEEKAKAELKNTLKIDKTHMEATLLLKQIAS